MGSGVKMAEYRCGGFDRYDAIVSILITVLTIYSVCVLNMPLFMSIAQGLILIFLFLGRSRIVKIEANKTSKEEQK